MNIKVLAVLLSLFCAHVSLLAQDAGRRSEQSNYIKVTNEGRMAAALAESKGKLGEFVLALKLAAPGTENFCVKKGFPTPSGGKEYIWISDVQYADGKFTGVIDNDPVDTTEVKAGQKVVVPRAEVEDWMYFKDGRLVGGYSIVALVYGSNEQAEYQKQMGIDWSKYKFLSLSR